MILVVSLYLIWPEISILILKDNNENIRNVSQTRNVTILDEEHKNQLEEHVIQ